MKKILTISLLSALASSAALADPYVFAQVGKSNYERSNCSAGCSQSGTSGGLGFGYTLQSGLALEAGYTTFGGVKFPTETGEFDVTSKGVFAGMAYEFPINNKSAILARGGLIDMKTEGNVDNFNPVSTTRTKPYYGFGGTYALTSTLKIGGGMTFSEAEFSADGIVRKADVKAFNLTLRYFF
jgi:hypothetical protein